MGSKKLSESKKKAPAPLEIKFPEELSGLFHKYHERILLDESVSDRDAVLLAIHLIEQQRGKAGVDYSECRSLFVSLGRKEDPNFRVGVHNATRESQIVKEGSVLYFLSGGLERIRTLLGQFEKAPVHVIKSGQSFTAVKLLEEFLLSEVDSNEVMLCDPYISPATLFPLAVMKGKVDTIKILTSNVQDSDKFGDYLTRFRKETGITIETKLNRKIHDRYLLSGEKCWSFGASIKDLGNKDTTIREISEVAKSMKDLFLERWNESQGTG